MKPKGKRRQQNRESSSQMLPISKDALIALNYLLGIIGGIALLIIAHSNTDKNHTIDKELLFHAWQSILTFGFLTLFLKWPIIYISSPLMMFLALYLAYNAYIGENVRIPIAGEIAEKIANKK